MIVFISDIILFVYGLYSVIFGRGRLAKRFGLAGWRARVVGLILMVPLPLTFIIVQAIVFVVLVIGADPLSTPVTVIARIVEWSLLLAGIACAIGFAWLVSRGRADRPATASPHSASPTADSEATPSQSQRES